MDRTKYLLGGWGPYIEEYKAKTVIYDTLEEAKMSTTFKTIKSIRHPNALDIIASSVNNNITLFAYEADKQPPGEPSVGIKIVIDEDSLIDVIYGLIMAADYQRIGKYRLEVDE